MISLRFQKTHTTYKRSSVGGFVLISSLLLIAFLVALVVGLLTLARLEYADSRRAFDLYVAKANAKFSAKLALAELQLHAGPDQAATSSADLLMAGAGNAHWTGVWNYADAPSTAVNDLTELENLRTHVTSTKGAVWMVSRPDLTVPASPTSVPTNPITMGEVQSFTVTPPSGGPGGSPAFVNQTQNVVVAPYALADEGGRIAWWVSDEGVKAEIAGQDQSAFAANQEKFRLRKTPQRSAPEKVKSSLAQSYSATDDAFDRLYSTGSMALLDGQTALDEAIPKDFTVNSRGVIADQRKGGLKTDLTAVFEDTQQYDAFLADSNVNPDGNYLYGGAGSQGVSLLPFVGNKGGYINPLWNELFNYYRLYRPENREVLERNSNLIDYTRDTEGSANSYRNHQDPEDASAIPSFMPRNMMRGKPGWRDAYGQHSFAETRLTPELISWQLNLGISSYQKQVTLPINGAKNAYHYRAHIVPIMVMWNPYNVEISSSYNEVLSNFLAVNVDNDGIVIGVKAANGVNYIAYRGALALDVAGSWGKSGAMTARNKEAVVYAPGEVRVFGVYLDPSKINDYVINPIHPDLLYDPQLIEMGNSFEADIGMHYPLENNSGPHSKFLQHIDGVPSWGGNAFPADIIGNTKSNSQVFVGIPYGRVRSNDFQHWFELPTGETPAGKQILHREDIPEFILQPSDYFDASAPPGSPAPAPETVAGPNWKVVYAGTNAGLDVGASGQVTYYARFQIGGKPLDMETYCPVAPFSQWSYSKRTGADRYQSYSVTNQVYPRSDGILDVDFSLDESGGTVVNGFWGQSNRISTGRSFIASHDVPRGAAQSLGEFMHAKAFHYELQPAYPIGNSYIPPHIHNRKDVVEDYQSQSRNAAVEIEDRSYLSNAVLFDSHFLSSVPGTWRDADTNLSGRSSTSDDGTSAFPSKTYKAQDYFFPYGQTFDDAYIAAGNPLPNPRISYYGAPAATDLQSYQTAAANLMIDGAFNVNSTSVEAWRSVLSTMFTEDVEVWETSRDADVPGGSTATTSSGYHTINNDSDGDGVADNWISRLSTPATVVGDGANTPNDPWSGLRNLSDTELDALATAIVDQVRLRGPFLGLGDFVNRRLVSSSGGASDPDDLGFSGALQAAIDSTTINAAALSVGSPLVSPITGAALDMLGDGALADMEVDNLVQSSSVGIPGYLLQNDLLRHLAPVLQARSDTFIIRGYGEAPNGLSGALAGSKAKARCEMVVQRVPDYIDPADTAETRPAAASPLNQALGRRFKIVNFRWYR